MNIRSDKAVMMALILILCMAIPVSAEDRAAADEANIPAAGMGLEAELNADTNTTDIPDAGSTEAEASDASSADGDNSAPEDQDEEITAEEDNEADAEEDNQADAEEDGFVLEEFGVRYYVFGKGSISMKDGKLSFKVAAGHHLEAVYVGTPAGDAESAPGISSDNAENEEEINIDSIGHTEFEAGSRVTFMFEPNETDGCRADNSGAAIYDGVREGNGDGYDM